MVPPYDEIGTFAAYAPQLITEWLRQKTHFGPKMS